MSEEHVFVLLALVIVITLMTLVGHGTWLLVAWLIRALLGRPSAKPSAPTRVRCPVCQADLSPPLMRCLDCGWQDSLGGAQGPLGIAERQIAGLAERGLLGHEVHQQLVQALAEERARLQAGNAATPAGLGSAPRAPRAPVPPTPIASSSSGDPPASEDIVSAELVIPTTVPSVPTAPPAPALSPRESETEFVPRAASAPTGASHSAKSPEERVRRYAASRQAAAAERPSRETEPATTHKRPWGEFLAAFMEEKNIRWGELVGGLLIVSCSIALVVSFWSEIAERPLLKFGIFNGVTAALFGIGLHAAKRWKLPTTSQGLLINATMLVPLNFLAIAAFTEAAGPTDIVALVGEGLSLAVFTALVFLAGRVILPDVPALLTLAVMGQSIVQLVIRRFVGPDAHVGLLYAIGCISLLIYNVASVWLSRDTWRGSPLSERRANEIFKLLGLSTFAALLPACLMLLKTENGADTLRQLSPLFGFACIPALSSGLVLWRKTGEKSFAGIRTAGTSVGVAGAALLLVGVAVAWPDPGTLLPTALISFFTLTALAWLLRIPEGHFAAAPLLAVAYLLAFHCLTGRLPWWVEGPQETVAALLSAASGNVLLGLVSLFGIAAWMCSRGGRQHDGANLGIITVATAAVSLGLVTWRGFALAGDPSGATWVYGVYAAASLAAAAITGRAWAGWIGAGLALAAIVQAVVFRYATGPPTTDAWLAALLLHGSAMALGAFGCRWAPAAVLSSGPRVLLQPLTVWALNSSMAAAAVMLGQLVFPGAWPAASYLFWLAGVWFVTSWACNSAWLFTGFQAALTAGVMLSISDHLATYPWYAASPYGWVHPGTLQVQGLAMVALSLLWLGIRSVLRRGGVDRAYSGSSGWRETAATLLYPPWPRVDQLMTFASVVLLAGLAVYGVIPGIAQELSPQPRLAQGAQAQPTTIGETANLPARQVPLAEEFEIAGVPHRTALGRGSWYLLVALLVLLVGLAREQFSYTTLSVLAVAVAAVCPLLAGRWEAEVSVASALRWYTAGMFALGSTIIWSRHRLFGWTYRRTAFPGRPQPATDGLERPSYEGLVRNFGRLSYQLLVVLVVLTVLPLAAMAVFVAVSAVRLSPPTADQWQVLWWLMIVFLVCAVIWIGVSVLVPEGRARFARRVGWTSSSVQGRRTDKDVHPTWLALLVLGAAPLLAMTLFVIAMALKQHPVVGPDPSSFFSRIGLSASYALPLVIIAASLVGHAIDRRSPGLALTAGLVFNFCATAAYLLAQRGAGLLMAEQWWRLAQLNGIAASVYALSWIAFLRLRWPGIARVGFPSLLVTQVGIAVGFISLLVIPPGLVLFVDPRTLVPLPEAAGVWGWGALVVSLSAVVALRGLGAEPLRAWVFGAGLWGLATLLACEADRWDAGNWLSFHTLLVMHLVAASGMLGLGWWLFNRAAPASLASDRRLSPSQRQRHALDQAVAVGSALNDPASVTRWTSAFLLVAIVLSGRAVLGDPGRPWWSVFGLAAAGAVSMLLAIWSGRQRCLYLAGGLVNLATSIWWIDRGRNLVSASSGWVELFHFLEVNIATLAFPAILWMIVDKRWIAAEPHKSRAMGFHRVATAVSVMALASVVAISLLSAAAANPSRTEPIVGWIAFAGTLLAATSCLWDERAKLATASLYITGLVGLGMLVDQFSLPPSQLRWTGTMVLAAYALGTSYLWSRRSGLVTLAGRLRIPVREDDQWRGLRWLVPANCCLAAAVAVLGCWAALSLDDGTMRLAASQAVIAQAFAVGMLARGRRESELRVVALCLAVVGAIAFGWSWLNPGASDRFLNRTVVVAVALAAMAVLYGLGLTKVLRRENAWTRAAQRLVPTLAALALSSVGVCLIAEVVLYASRGIAAMAWPAILAIAITLLGLAVGCLTAAIVPGRDPLGLSQRQRMIYVYTAEAMLALLFLHVRLTMPWLFSGFFQRCWPLIIMLLAFLGVGLSEWFRRQQRSVLAEPLEKTGALLPLLPVVGYWVAPADVHYSLLMLAVGVLYGGLSVVRRSFGFGILAALAVNGGLWYLLHETRGLGIFEHPQVWLIPPSLCVLAASYLNRQRLTAAQMTTIRYLTSTVIYTSSTADVFLNGVASAPWLPLLLAGFAILGVLAGILLRVRAFLFLGTSFLGLALLTIIWHAAVDLQQTWLWFVTGIVAGALIIAMFAVFEKKRETVLRVVDDLKKWEA